MNALSFTIPAFRIVLLFLAIAMPRDASAWGPPHAHISRVAIERLPDWQREMLKPEEDHFADDYSYYPDKFFTPEAKPYVLPDPPEMKAVNHIPASREQNEMVFRHYFPLAVDALQKDRLADGMKYLGCIAHFIQDSSSPGHVRFGETRIDPLGPPLQQMGGLMDLLDVSDETRTEWIHLRIDHCPFTAEELRRALGDYRPSLLGESIEELVFHLGERHEQMNRRCGRHLIPMILALDRKDDAAFKAEGLAAATEGAKLLADVLHTALCIARNRFTAHAPAKVNLAEFTPATWTSFKWSDRNHQGRFIRNASGSWHPKVGEPAGLGRHPLRLQMVDGAVREFAAGFGVGHESEYTFLLPRGAFKTFTVLAGNDAKLGKEGRNKFEILLDGKVVASTEILTGESPAAKLEVSLGDGARLTLRCTSTGKPDKTHAVWAEPMLSKQ